MAHWPSRRHRVRCPVRVARRSPTKLGGARVLDLPAPRSTLVALFCLLGSAPAAAAPSPARCLRGAGDEGARCLAAYTKAVGRCRARADAVACEAALRDTGGALEQILARPEAPIRRRCDEPSADTLGYLGVEDAVLQIPQACGDFAEDQLGLAFAADPGALDPTALRCQAEVAKRTQALAGAVVKAFGTKCYARAYAGGRCDRAKRYAAVARAQARAAERILARCGSEFDALGLATGPSLEARVEDLLGAWSSGAATTPSSSTRRTTSGRRPSSGPTPSESARSTSTT